MLRDDEIDGVIEMLEKHFERQLTPWECDFLENIKEQWEARRFLTSPQRDKLDQIAERCARSHGR